MLTVKKEDYETLQFLVKLQRNDLKGWKTELQLGIYEGDKKIKNLMVAFIGPEVYN